ncbi:hypothetical protein [Nocardia vinacea]|uniref:hypothetical protein n=1 Tax=Nocardia vinacea TaxID=96468 RepID=UPI0002F8EDE7|nr:hypothetical protein [Nocardia vinacea]
MAFGALIENIETAAAHLGLRASTRIWPDSDDASLVCTVTLSPDAHRQAAHPITDVITRVTNRRRAQRRLLGEHVSGLFAKVCSDSGGRLQLVSDDDALAELGALAGDGDRIGMLNQAMHHDIMRGYRWTAEEVRNTPHGLDLATAEFTAIERAVLGLLRRWPVAQYLGQIGGGGALADLSRTAVTDASAMGLLTVPGLADTSYLHGGRVLQRLWLAATAHRVAVQPMTTLPYLFARLERGDGQGLNETERATLRDLRARYQRLFDTGPDQAEIVLLRFGHADAPSARSLRRPLDNVLRFACSFLAQHPEHRRELLQHPERLDSAVEEFLRDIGLAIWVGSRPPIASWPGRKSRSAISCSASPRWLASISGSTKTR